MRKYQKHYEPYILDAIEPSDYDVKCSTSKELLQFLYDTFTNEYCFADNIRRYGNQINCLREFIPCLPSYFNIDYENYKIIEIAKKWGSLPENSTERQEQKIIDNWYNFIAVKTFQLFKKYKITMKII